MPIYCGDSAELLRLLPDGVIDSIVTDPPAGISFRGELWDDDKGGRDRWIAWMQSIAAEGLRIAKPGAYALVWALPRTAHWTTTAWENAGWEVRDVIHHVFGQGFAKVNNLKPAVENWVLLRKPLDGTLAENVLKHGTGRLNIKQCLVEGGRLPANLTHDGSDEVVGMFPSPHGAGFRRDAGNGKASKTFGGGGDGFNGARFGDEGSAARFFYASKVSQRERDMGLDDGEHNNHLTVKSVTLLRYLCRLITPPGGGVLDCFAGTGSVGIAAALEGFNYTGIELDPEYCRIAEKRIAAVKPLSTIRRHIRKEPRYDQTP